MDRYFVPFCLFLWLHSFLWWNSTLTWILYVIWYFTFCLFILQLMDTILFGAIVNMLLWTLVYRFMWVKFSWHSSLNRIWDIHGGSGGRAIYPLPRLSSWVGIRRVELRTLFQLSRELGECKGLCRAALVPALVCNTWQLFEDWK